MMINHACWGNDAAGEMMVVLVVIGVCGSGKTTVAGALAKKIGCRLADADNWHPKSNVMKMKSGIPLTDKDRLPWLEALHDLLKSWERGAQEEDKEYSVMRKNIEEIPEDVVREDEATTQRDSLWNERMREKCPMVEEFTREHNHLSEEGVVKKRTHQTLGAVSGILACSALRQAYREILTGVANGSHGKRCGLNCVFVVLCGSEEVIRERLEGRQGHYMPPSLLHSQLKTLELPTEDEGRGCILIEDLTMPVDAIVSYVLQQLALLA